VKRTQALRFLIYFGCLSRKLDVIVSVAGQLARAH
jgi:hypothetical protein